MNSIYNDMRPMPSRVTNFAQVLNNFNQFRNSFTGNAESQVKQMLQNGQMSQEQFNQVAQMANQLLPLLK